MTEAQATLAVELFWEAVRLAAPHPEDHLALACTGVTPAEMRTIHERLLTDARGTEPQKGKVLTEQVVAPSEMLAAGYVEHLDNGMTTISAPTGEVVGISANPTLAWEMAVTHYRQALPSALVIGGKDFDPAQIEALRNASYRHPGSFKTALTVLRPDTPLIIEVDERLSDAEVEMIAAQVKEHLPGQKVILVPRPPASVDSVIASDIFKQAVKQIVAEALERAVEEAMGDHR